ncbi:hypothetical protein TNCV_4569321 [Trichonephila clavipes]|nr:hypothetical protein TNCV_4569321 [Trichonephila clavipes]
MASLSSNHELSRQICRELVSSGVVAQTHSSLTMVRYVVLSSNVNLPCRSKLRTFDSTDLTGIVLFPGGSSAVLGSNS